MTTKKVSLARIAPRLDTPFFMRRVAQVDHFTIYVYLCQGFVARHRHVSQDELFFVQDGLLSIDTDWGRITLSRRELTVVPRGLSHTSGSVVRSIVVLLQAHADPDRKNGHGRLSADSSIDALPKWSVTREVARLSDPYLPVRLAQVDEMSLRLVLCQGRSRWHLHPHHDELEWVQEGHLGIETEAGLVELLEDELVVIPRGTLHRLESSRRTVALSLVRGELSPQAHMGREEETEP